MRLGATLPASFRFFSKFGFLAARWPLVWNNCNVTWQAFGKRFFLRIFVESVFKKLFEPRSAWATSFKMCNEFLHYIMFIFSTGRSSYFQMNLFQEKRLEVMARQQSFQSWAHLMGFYSLMMKHDDPETVQKDVSNCSQFNFNHF